MTSRPTQQNASFRPRHHYTPPQIYVPSCWWWSWVYSIDFPTVLTVKNLFFRLTNYSLENSHWEKEKKIKIHAVFEKCKRNFTFHARTETRNTAQFPLLYATITEYNINVRHVVVVVGIKTIKYPDASIRAVKRFFSLSYFPIKFAQRSRSLNHVVKRVTCDLMHGNDDQLSDYYHVENFQSTASRWLKLIKRVMCQWSCKIPPWGATRRYEEKNRGRGRRCTSLGASSTMRSRISGIGCQKNKQKIRRFAFFFFFFSLSRKLFSSKARLKGFFFPPEAFKNPQWGRLSKRMLKKF